MVAPSTSTLSQPGRHRATRFGSRSRSQTASGAALTVNSSSKSGMGYAGFERNAASTRSDVIGSSVIRGPSALERALATAAMLGVMAGSPSPLAPNGPSPSPDSSSTVAISGASSEVGIL